MRVVTGRYYQTYHGTLYLLHGPPLSQECLPQDFIAQCVVCSTFLKYSFSVWGSRLIHGAVDLFASLLSPAVVFQARESRSAAGKSLPPTLTLVSV